MLYGELVSKRQAFSTARLGELLVRHYGDQAPRIATQLAIHFERGRDFGRAVEYFIRAGDNAAAIYANAEAEEHFSHALGLLAKLPDTDREEREATILQKRGAANMALSRFDRAVSDFDRVLELAHTLGDPERESAALNALAILFFYSHRLDEMVARAEEASRLAEHAGNPILRAQAMLFIALKHLADGELVALKPILDEIVQTARATYHKPVLCAGSESRGSCTSSSPSTNSPSRVVRGPCPRSGITRLAHAPGQPLLLGACPG